MIKDPHQRISTDAVKVWRISDAITYFVMLCILIIFLLLQYHYGWKDWIRILLYLLMILLVVSSVLEIIVIPIYKQRNWRYDVDEQYIQLKRGGAFFKVHLIIPISKVQYVDTHQGPLLQKYGLSTVKIATMASEHEIPAIPEKKAKKLRDRIAFLSGICEQREETPNES